MVSKLRRLIADHADLHNNELPPNYLFSPTDSHSDDMTQLVVMLAGPQGTPYSAGLWRLQLRIPQDYPARPPTATFKTRIWHPNVEQSTGAVCVDTLKRDWVSDLTLRDILVTISCLLIHPNPDSALNAMAGSLLQDDYDEFARQARLMTSIHAPVPFNLKDAVLQAKRRGEDPELAGQIVDMHEAGDLTYGAKSTSLFTKKSDEEASILQNSKVDEDMEDVEDNCKENDPPTMHAPAMSSSLPWPQRKVLRNRPLSIIPTTPVLDTDMIMLDCGTDDEGEWSIGMTASEQNIVANVNSSLPGTRNASLFFNPTGLQQTAYASSKISNSPTTNNDSTAISYAIFEDYENVGIRKSVRDAEKASYGKENEAGFLPLQSKESSEVLSSSCSPELSIVQSLLLKSRAPSSPPLSSSKTVAAKPISPTKVTKSIYINNSNNIANRSGSGIGNTRKTKASKGRQRTGLRRL